VRLEIYGCDVMGSRIGRPASLAPTPKAALARWQPASRRDASDLTEELSADPPERRGPEESRELALCVSTMMGQCIAAL
jgi:hypothetical protein